MLPNNRQQFKFMVSGSLIKFLGGDAGGLCCVN